MEKNEVRLKVLLYVIDWHDKWGKRFDISSLWIYWNQNFNPGCEKGENLADNVVYAISETVLDLVHERILIPSIGYHGFSTKEFQISNYERLLELKAALDH